MAINIEKLTIDDLEQTLAFALQARILLFPDLRNQPLPPDLQYFAETYISHPQGCCFIAKFEQRIIGMVAYRHYDQRFNLDIAQDSVEVVKLFIDPIYRRKKIASQLCDMLFAYAEDKKISNFYLHTHPFLTGAELFWEKQGFSFLKREWIQTFDTIHMVKI